MQSSLKNASTATIFGRVTDNVRVAEVTIDGQPVMINSDGSFSTEGYIPRAGREAEVIAYDLKGNQSSQTLFLHEKRHKKHKALYLPHSIHPVNVFSLILMH